MSTPVHSWFVLLALALAGPAVRAQAETDLAAIGTQVEQMAKDGAGLAGLGSARIEVEVGCLDPRL
jgi:hypothetical protein